MAIEITDQPGSMMVCKIQGQQGSSAMSKIRDTMATNKIKVRCRRGSATTNDRKWTSGLSDDMTNRNPMRCSNDERDIDAGS